MDEDVMIGIGVFATVLILVPYVLFRLRAARHRRAERKRFHNNKYPIGRARDL